MFIRRHWSYCEVTIDTAIPSHPHMAIKWFDRHGSRDCIEIILNQPDFQELLRQMTQAQDRLFDKPKPP